MRLPTRAWRQSLLISLFAVVVALPAQAVERRHRVPPAGSKQITRASWYGKSFGGRRTAGGTVFNPKKLTAAHPTLHLGSKVKVTELRSGRSVVVQITDRGPFLPNRGIDLSYAAAQQLGIVRRGVVRVQVEVLRRQEPEPEPPIVTASNWPMTPWLPKAIVE